MILNHRNFSEALPRSCASWPDWISNMSLIAASFTKSAVVGATPKTEFTPVFSPTDCASAGVASRTSAKVEARYFIVEPFPVWVGVPNQLRTLRIVPRMLWWIDPGWRSLSWTRNLSEMPFLVVHEVVRDER